MSDWQAVIGLEVHVQLRTRTKLFCRDPVDFGAPPNTRVCPVCLGLPGALPVLNARAVELAVRAALGLGCRVHEYSSFDRKSYFYPDLPRGYQITQYERPLATGGVLPLQEEATPVRIRRLHLEEDAGRLLHDRFPQRTAIDYNRAGVALAEIVSEPDLRDPGAAREFLVRLRRLLRHLEVSDCDLEKGSMRADVNVSVHRRGGPPGANTEVKNLNSLAHVERATRHEIARQIQILESGGEIRRETMLWDADAGVVRSMRGKEEEHEYRYFPEPDLPPLRVPPSLLAEVQSKLPELPWIRERRFRQVYGLPEYDADVLTAERAVADYFEAVAGACGDPKAAANWVMTHVLAWRNEQPGANGFPLAPDRLARIIRLVASGGTSHHAARIIFAEAASSGRDPEAILAEREWRTVGDDAALRSLVALVLAESPDQAARFRAGKARLLDYFVGRVLRRSGERADPRRVAEILRELLPG